VPGRPLRHACGAKITHLGLPPQGSPERNARALDMVSRHDAEGFGGCTQIGECSAVCPKGIPLDVISRYHSDTLTALFHR
jgi:succinate dehydrogenase / fumarate reductase, iron-sulfur subunit